MVFLHVHTGAVDAFAADAWADDFGEAVVVEGCDVEVFFNVLAHIFGPWFCAEVA